MTTSDDTPCSNIDRMTRKPSAERKSISAVTDSDLVAPDIPSGRPDDGVSRDDGFDTAIDIDANVDADTAGGPASSRSLANGVSCWRPSHDASSRTPSGNASSSTPANDNESGTMVLRRAGDDPAVVIGLALRHVRSGRDVPFPIVCALHRLVKAGDGAAKATVDLIRRRIERRQRDKFEAYVARGLRSASFPGPHGCATEPPGSPRRSSAGGRGDAAARERRLSWPELPRLVLVSHHGMECNREGGK